MIGKKAAAALAVGSVFSSALIGASYGPAPNRPFTMLWYTSLRKHPYTPSGPSIGIGWTVLDCLLCIIGYRLILAPPSRDRRLALGSWAMTVVGIPVFSWLMFGKRALGASLAGAGAIVASSSCTTWKSRNVDQLAAVVAVPLIAWTLFAGLLNEELRRRN